MGKIELTRSSVCMGDDCTAPNSGTVEYSFGEQLSSVMFKIAKYVPTMKESIWTVKCDMQIVGHLVFDKDKSFKVFLDIPDCNITSLRGEWFCSYHPFGFIESDARELPDEIRSKCTDYLTMLRAVESI